MEVFEQVPATVFHGRKRQLSSVREHGASVVQLKKFSSRHCVRDTPSQLPRDMYRYNIKFPTKQKKQERFWRTPQNVISLVNIVLCIYFAVHVSHL